MKEKALVLYNNLEAQREKLVNIYNSMSTEQLHFKPQPESWNLLQVMRHLVTAERQSLILIQRRITKRMELPKAGLGASIRYLILNLALYLPVKYKAPKIAEVKEEVPDFEKMKQEWANIRAEMKELIAGTDQEILLSAVYIHPRAGLLNMNQALGFMITHIDHHLKQVERIRSHPVFPGKNI